MIVHKAKIDYGLIYEVFVPNGYSGPIGEASVRFGLIDSALSMADSLSYVEIAGSDVSYVEMAGSDLTDAKVTRMTDAEVANLRDKVDAARRAPGRWVGFIPRRIVEQPHDGTSNSLALTTESAVTEFIKREISAASDPMQRAGELITLLTSAASTASAASGAGNE